MKVNGITDIFFDLDHTLWDFDRNSALTFAKIFELNKIDVEVNDFLFHYEPINLNYWKLYREEKIDKQSLRFGRLNDAFLAVGEKVSKDLIYKLADDYITYLTTHNYLFENTLEVLNYLTTNYILHIITNGFEEVQQKKLIRSNIDKYFKTVTNSEMVGVKKPNPKIFNYALNMAETKVENSIMIGDSYEADILGAQNVGMDVIFFDATNTVATNGVKKINNLIQLKKYL
ncbi:noncanonical pyrimidine nucleotidase, YjjG family [Seonamhaeicola sp. S2-3]|uniref:YjjG family noncanonical pyrimidine nucleotidase n=1 Tax=Seonamhaeicola sp. S2-3 TaxID=1936081 RepID=UPI000972B286|nr:YjjG family noncanonical pyrimidine nucleotidase [Seonamhaeicola sp. S2-3]APY10388.1 noncanonical pyrimidine nucleotidase, YjjG family [Seonamhaeicola sp. S2-3]